MTKSNCEDEYLHFRDESDYVPDWLEDIILLDDVEKFMEIFPCPQNGDRSLAAVEKDAQKPYCPKAISSFIFIHRAVNCAIALLEGDTGLILNPNHPCSLGQYPLHIAASKMSYDLVDLLLHHGALADVRTTEVKPYTRGGLLPLSVAVEHFRLHSFLLAWTPKQSIFRLIIIFCLPEMKWPLEICKLLALRTMDVAEVFNGYCLDGKLFEVVALLMVAQEKLIDTVSGRLLIHERIAGEIDKLINEEIKLLRTSKSVRACKNRIKNLQNTLSVLEVFERAGDAIRGYVRCRVNHYITSAVKEEVANDIRSLLVERGFLLTPKDTDLSDIDCEQGDINLASHMLETRHTFRGQGISWLGGSQLASVGQKVLHCKNKDWAMRGYFAKIPILWHGQDMSKRNPHMRRPTKHSDEPLPLLRLLERGYFSIAWAAKKGLKYI